MAKFIVPDVEDVKYRNAALPYRNDIVNLKLCKSIKKGEKRLEYDTVLPSLQFVGCDTSWVFLTFTERDDALNKIIKNK